MARWQYMAMATGRALRMWRKGIALDQPVLLVGIIFTAIVAAAILGLTVVIGGETVPDLAQIIQVFRCILMGPVA